MSDVVGGRWPAGFGAWMYCIDYHTVLTDKYYGPCRTLFRSTDYRTLCCTEYRPLVVGVAGRYMLYCIGRQSCRLSDTGIGCWFVQQSIGLWSTELPVDIYCIDLDASVGIGELFDSAGFSA